MKVSIRRTATAHVVASVSLLLISAGQIRASDDAKTILSEAGQREGAVKSGRISFLSERRINHLSASELRKIIRDPKMLQMAMEQAKHEPTRTSEKVNLLFDNSRDQLLHGGTRDNSIREFKTLFTPTSLKTYIKYQQEDAAWKEEVNTQKPVWPPYWPYNVLRARLWDGRVDAVNKGQINPKLLRRNPETGQVTILLAGGPGAQLDQKIWVEMQRDYTMSQLQFVDKKTGRIAEEVKASYKQYGSLWYPEKIVDQFFAYDQKGKRYLVRTDTIVAEKVELNVNLSENDFEFRAIPFGAFVQDDRFNPPLTYRQGNKQFTDEELFQASKHREILSDPRWFKTSPSPLAYVGVIIGLLMVIFAIFTARRQHAPQRVRINS